MTLATSRIVLQGETPHAHERAAIDFAIQSLPNTTPYHLWALLELLDPSTGRLLELDMVILGYSALYLVEVKSGPGRYVGDALDWYRTPPGASRSHYMENPYRLVNAKARVLASRLRAALRNPRAAPWVQPLVFLSAPDISLDLRNHGDTCVVTRDTFRAAIERHAFPGADDRNRPRIAEPAMRDIAQAIAAIGLRPRKGKAFVGSYQLGPVLAEGPGFQDRQATHRDTPALTRRARVYAVPQASSIERRQQLRRAAEREVRLLEDLRDHPQILRITDYVPDAELGPTVLLEDFAGAMPLDAFIRNENPTFDERLDILEAIARALAHCHRKAVVHGALSPEAVLVRRKPAGDGIDVRLFNFQLGVSPDITATAHWTALGTEPWALYQAPELREDPSSRSPLSDVFSLGALAFFLFTGRPPAASPVELDRYLARHRQLDPRVVDDSLPAALAELIGLATDRVPVNRIDDCTELIEFALNELTRPDDARALAPELDPLLAKPGDALGDELLVESADNDLPVLGQGATSRVLKVTRVSDGRSYALKISLSPEHDARLGAEADELERLRHPHIVQLVARLTFAGRPCLLLSLAGTETLQRRLAREGSVALEYALRFGEDLLDALDYLETQGILHRDLKPANLGVGSVSKTAERLVLFDFSLAGVPLSDIQVGTAAYRDPFLNLRGTWDHAAERWGAAVTLHELLTGIRPSFDRPVVDPDASLFIAIERFDPAVREALAAFFTRAFARDLEHRFASASEMRRAWSLAIGVDAAASGAPQDGPVALPSPDRLAEIGPKTPVEALPLSARARNALDRAGLLTAGDLRGLPDNRLSAIRGIGRKVAQEILAFRDAWAAVRPDDLGARPPLFPGYRGEDVPLPSLGDATLPGAALAALVDAGYPTAAALAAAPKDVVKALARRLRLDLRALTALLRRLNDADATHSEPATLEAWVDALLPARSRRYQHPRALFGLDESLPSAASLTVRAFADARGLTPAAVYLALGKARGDWADHPALGALRHEAHTVLAESGGALPLDKAAQALAARIPAARTTPAATATAIAAALLRVIAEVDRDDPAGLRALRLEHGPLWLAASDDHARTLKALGGAADAFAARAIVPAPSEVARAFTDIALGSPLAALPADRLAAIAALASARAACSARLEIYPRGMDAARAIALSHNLLRSGITPDQILHLVSARYPEAAPVPPRPELDGLVKPHGLTWDESLAGYIRQGEAHHTLLSSRLSSIHRAPTALPHQPLSMEPAAVVARQFDERLRDAFERRELRIIGVRANRAPEAALAIAQRLGIAPRPLDSLLVAAIREEMQAGGIKREDIIHAADRTGPEGPHWRNLLRLAEVAATRVADSILPARAPLLLIQPGLIGRYRLDAFARRLMESRRDAPVFILVPSRDTGGLPTIGDYPIPGLLPSQVLWVPSEWIANQHNRAA